MTRMKKLFGILLALVLMVTAMTASAATVANSTNHSYDAYQVFTGTQAENGGIALGDVEWGTGVNGDALLTTLKADYDYFDTCATAADVAAVLAETADKSDEAKAFANAAAKNLTSTVTASIAAGATSVNLPAGYYLLVDTTENLEEHDAYNTALLQVTNKGDITIEAKYTVPSVDKDIIEGSAELEATSRKIGEEIDFQITGTLPSNYADYDTYTYEFHDEMSDALSLDVTTVVVTIGGTTTTLNDYFDISYTNNKLTIACEDLKVISGLTGNSTLVVTYTATLNENAVTGEEGNPNKVKVTFSNDPNATGKPTTSDTPEDEVLVFTYKLDVDKIDGATAESETPTLLKDAEFVLMDSTQTKVAKIVNGKLAGWVNDSEITKNEDGTYPAEYTLKSDANGNFVVTGLDNDTYYIKETKAPAGYNLLKNPIKVVITEEIDSSEENPALKKLEITVDEEPTQSGNIKTGTVEATILNNSGATLPETGGIGTTILYVAGGLLIAAALVVLLAKRRTAA